jgi:IS30 family transposase
VAWKPLSAQRSAREHARRMRRSIFARDEVLRAIVQAKLQLQWSPEQIAAWPRAEYPIQPQWHGCHETIYQGLYFGGTRGLTRDLARNLLSGRGLRCGDEAQVAVGPGSAPTPR